MTYLYETFRAREGENAKQFEIKQSANEARLTKHPETGDPIRRVMLGGLGLVSTKPGSGSSSQAGCGCGPSGCC